MKINTSYKPTSKNTCATNTTKTRLINYLIKKPPFSLLIISTLSLSLIADSSAAWTQPYLNNSEAYKILHFNNGNSDSATAQLPSYGNGLKYSTSPSSDTGGGWSLRSSGSVGYGNNDDDDNWGNWGGNDHEFSATSQAQTKVAGNTLLFNIKTSNYSELYGAGANPAMTWKASSTITGSNTWEDCGPNSNYAYQFDLGLSSALVNNDDLSLFNSITLTIKAGSSTRYEITGLKNILGVSNITQTSYNDASVQFTYDQNAGPLEIIWSGDASVSAATLALLGSGTNTFFSVSDGAIMVDCIPEPSTYALMIGAAGMLILCRTRKNNVAKR